MINVNVFKKANTVIIDNFEREFTLENADDYAEYILNVFRKEPHDMILDMKNVSYIDSKGIGRITHIIKNVTSAEHRITIYNVQPFVAKLFKLSQLNKVIEFFESDLPPHFRSSQETSDKTYIISDILTETQKQQILNIIKSECEFKSFKEVSLKFVEQTHSTHCKVHKADLEHLSNASDIIEKCNECRDFQKCELIAYLIEHHSSNTVKKELVKWVVKWNTPDSFKILKKAFIHEKNEQMKTVLSDAIQSLRKR